MKPNIHNKTLIYRSPIHGFGIIATEPIMTDEVIEKCVAIPCPQVAGVLDDYRLDWTENEDAIATGNALIYNHSDTPNVKFIKNIENRTITIKAIRNISIGEELFKKYVCGPWW